MMSRSILNDLHMVDDTDEPNLDDLDPIGHVRETNDNVPINIEPGSKETTTSTKTMGHSESVKIPRKRMAPRSKVWTEGHFIPVKDKDGNVIKERMYGNGEIEVENPLEGLEIDLHFDIDNEYRDLEYQSSNKATGMEITDGVKRSMEDLFNEYRKKYSTQESGKSSLSNMSMSSQGSSSMESQNTNRITEEFKKRRTRVILGDKSELDKYLSEDVEEVDETFDILGWWKVNSARFPILARIARDVLAIPISTVASESAFSTRGRILDAFRSSLSPNIVEALICSQDWIKVKNRIDVEEDIDFADKFECAISNMPVCFIFFEHMGIFVKKPR